MTSESNSTYLESGVVIVFYLDSIPKLAISLG